MSDYLDNEATPTYKIQDPGKFRLDDFELYKLAREYRKQVYFFVNKLPEKEKYNLTSQMRDAIISVSNNIAEGHGRWHYKETIQFCRIARGSIEEVIDDLNICIDENYFDKDECARLKDGGYSLIKKINGYIAYLNKQRSK